jgi:hypothetical protein
VTRRHVGIERIADHGQKSFVREENGYHKKLDCLPL